MKPKVKRMLPEDLGAESSSSKTKRKRNALTIQQKVELLKNLDCGIKVSRLCKKYGVGISTIYDIKSQKEKIFNFYAESDSLVGIAKRKTLRGPKHRDLDRVLYEWFRQRRSEGIHVSGPMLMEKAKAYHDEMHLESDCDYSTGWLQKFKNRHGIRYLKTCGEKLSPDHVAAEKFVNNFSKLVQEHNLSPEQVYNAHETGLFWRSLPRHAFVSNDEYLEFGVKRSEESLTILTCANAAGTHKCKLLVIGKSAKPRAFKGIKFFPVSYQSNNCAWVTQNVIRDWFESHFVPEVREHAKKVGLPDDAKIMLLIDNCSAHPPAETMSTRNVFATYLPPDCTTLIQPMEQGIIRNMKCHYRGELLQKLVSYKGPYSYDSFKRSFTVKDAVWGIARAWDNVTPKVLKQGWYNIWPEMMLTDDTGGSDFYGYEVSRKNADLAELINYTKGVSNALPNLSEKELEEWVDCDENTPTFQTLTDSEIIDAVLRPKSVDNGGMDDSDVQVDEQKVFMEASISPNSVDNRCNNDSHVQVDDQRLFIDAVLSPKSIDNGGSDDCDVPVHQQKVFIESILCPKSIDNSGNDDNHMQVHVQKEMTNAVLSPESVDNGLSDDSDVPVHEEMTVVKAISSCNDLINFMEQNSFNTDQEILQMYRLKMKFEKELHNRSKKKTITRIRTSGPRHLDSPVCTPPFGRSLLADVIIKVEK